MANVNHAYMMEYFIFILNINYIINIIYNTLVIVDKEENPEAIAQYIDGLNLFMSKNNKQIQNWIKVNLIYLI